MVSGIFSIVFLFVDSFALAILSKPKYHSILRVFVNTFLISLVLIPFTFLPFYIFSLDLYPFFFFSLSLLLLFLLILNIERLERLPLKKMDFFLSVYFLGMIVLYFLLLKKMNFSIMGADIGRFAMVAHALKLKGKITPNLRPYDMASGFFYFPGSLLILLFPDMFCLDQFVFVSSFVLFSSLLYPLIVFLILRRFVNKRKAYAGMLASTILNPVLDFSLAGVYPYGVSVLFLVYSLLVLLEKNASIKEMSLGCLGILLYHWFLLLPLAIFVFSLLILCLKDKKKLEKKAKCIIISGVISFLLFLPFLGNEFYKYVLVSFSKRNRLDILAFSYEKLADNLVGRILKTLFFTHVGIKYSPFLLIFFSFLPLFVLDKNSKFFKSFVLISFLLTLSTSLIVYPHMNYGRFIVLLWIFYAFFASSVDCRTILILFLISFMTFSPSIEYYALNLRESHTRGTPPGIVDKDLVDVARYIRKNLPPDSLILIDGGGAGCTGASGSYGERIFPLASRRIYYFSDYCWALYNFTEYQRRVDVYRRVSIDPCEYYDLLKKENITHILVGPTDVGLEKAYFKKCSKYIEIYSNNGYSLFEVR